MKNNHLKNILYKHLPSICWFLGFFGYPVAFFFMMAMNHYGYTNLQLRYYNKLYLFIALFYLCLFYKISEYNKKNSEYVGDKNQDEVYGYNKPIWLQIFYCINEFVRPSILGCLHLSFFLISSK